MKFKPQRLRSLSLHRGKQNEKGIFPIGRENIPCIADQLIQSLERQYSSRLSNKDIRKAILLQFAAGLLKIKARQKPGKYKVWCSHFTLYPMIKWPLKLYKVTTSAVNLLIWSWVWGV